MNQKNTVIFQGGKKLKILIMRTCRYGVEMRWTAMAFHETFHGGYILLKIFSIRTYRRKYYMW